MFIDNICLQFITLSNKHNIVTISEVTGVLQVYTIIIILSLLTLGTTRDALFSLFGNRSFRFVNDVVKRNDRFQKQFSFFKSKKEEVSLFYFVFVNDR